MKTIDFQVQALKYVLPYFRANEDIAVVLKAIAARFTGLQDAVDYLLNSLDIENARGIWLDYTGSEVGAQRDEVDYGSYFCVNRVHINEKKLFYFLSSELDPNTPLTLSDAEFIQKIFAYIGANSSCGNRDDCLEIIKTITNADKIILSKNEISISINLIGQGLILTKNTISYIKQILGSGIYLEEIKTNGTTT